MGFFTNFGCSDIPGSFAVSKPKQRVNAPRNCSPRRANKVQNFPHSNESSPAAGVWASPPKMRVGQMITPAFPERSAQDSYELSRPAAFPSAQKLPGYIDNQYPEDSLRMSYQRQIMMTQNYTNSSQYHPNSSQYHHGNGFYGQPQQRQSAVYGVYPNRKVEEHYRPVDYNISLNFDNDPQMYNNQMDNRLYENQRNDLYYYNDRQYSEQHYHKQANNQYYNRDPNSHPYDWRSVPPCDSHMYVNYNASQNHPFCVAPSNQRCGFAPQSNTMPVERWSPNDTKEPSENKDNRNTSQTVNYGSVGEQVNKETTDTSESIRSDIMLSPGRTALPQEVPAHCVCGAVNSYDCYRNNGESGNCAVVYKQTTNAHSLTRNCTTASCGSNCPPKSESPTQSPIVLPIDNTFCPTLDNSKTFRKSESACTAGFRSGHCETLQDYDASPLTSMSSRTDNNEPTKQSTDSLLHGYSFPSNGGSQDDESIRDSISERTALEATMSNTAATSTGSELKTTEPNTIENTIEPLMSEPPLASNEQRPAPTELPAIIKNSESATKTTEAPMNERPAATSEQRPATNEEPPATIIGSETKMAEPVATIIEKSPTTTAIVRAMNEQPATTTQQPMNESSAGTTELSALTNTGSELKTTEPKTIEPPMKEPTVATNEQRPATTELPAIIKNSESATKTTEAPMSEPPAATSEQRPPTTKQRTAETASSIHERDGMTTPQAYHNRSGRSGVIKPDGTPRSLNMKHQNSDRFTAIRDVWERRGNSSSETPARRCSGKGKYIDSSPLAVPLANETKAPIYAGGRKPVEIPEPFKSKQSVSSTETGNWRVPPHFSIYVTNGNVNICSSSVETGLHPGDGTKLQDPQSEPLASMAETNDSQGDPKLIAGAGISIMDYTPRPVRSPRVGEMSVTDEIVPSKEVIHNEHTKRTECGDLGGAVIKEPEIDSVDKSASMNINSSAVLPSGNLSNVAETAKSWKSVDSAHYVSPENTGIAEQSETSANLKAMENDHPVADLKHEESSPRRQDQIKHEESSPRRQDQVKHEETFSGSQVQVKHEETFSGSQDQVKLEETFSGSQDQVKLELTNFDRKAVPAASEPNCKAEVYKVEEYSEADYVRKCKAENLVKTESSSVIVESSLECDGSSRVVNRGSMGHSTWGESSSYQLLTNESDTKPPHSAAVECGQRSSSRQLDIVSRLNDELARESSSRKYKFISLRMSLFAVVLSKNVEETRPHNLFYLKDLEKALVRAKRVICYVEIIAVGSGLEVNIMGEKQIHENLGKGAAVRIQKNRSIEGLNLSGRNLGRVFMRSNTADNETMMKFSSIGGLLKWLDRAPLY